MGGIEWNHNTEVQRVLLDAVGEGRGRALDVGCGEGRLLAALAPRCSSVVGLDRHRPSLLAARAHVPRANVTLVQGDLLCPPVRPASFDAVLAVAAIHHVDERRALEAMRSLVAPGGVLGVVGLARSVHPRDLPWDLAGALTTRGLRLWRGRPWETDAPKVLPAPSTYREVAALVADVLPGAVVRRHVLWRYSVVWSAPGAG